MFPFKEKQIPDTHKHTNHTQNTHKHTQTHTKTNQKQPTTMFLQALCACAQPLRIGGPPFAMEIQPQQPQSPQSRRKHKALAPHTAPTRRKRLDTPTAGGRRSFGLQKSVFGPPTAGGRRSFGPPKSGFGLPRSFGPPTAGGRRSFGPPSFGPPTAGRLDPNCRREEVVWTPKIGLWTPNCRREEVVWTPNRRRE